ncbi:MAG: aminotransferase class I/II-fold pyridoxal phosphate-dependent enzyme [Deltaproteobacteria bacterium]|nr:aminotransferase class I/II-fold pyridoxal phosphate-dependent enzyme [Candidatus Zymogenaceae bacterium]
MKEKDNPSWKIDTRCVHAGEGTDPQTKAVRRPIHMANSYELPTDVEELVKTLSWEHLDKFNYTREHNPTARHLEERLAELEGGEDCVVAASGMGAIAATLFALLNAGDHIVCSEICYTGTQKLVSAHLTRFGVDATMVDTSDLNDVKAAIRPNTKVVFVETPGNPIVVISDIAAIAKIAHSVGALLVVDSTWSGLVTQHPFSLGADLVIHSTTKYINGHGDALGGAVIGPKAVLAEIRERGIVHLGACISPFNAWLILRGSATLPIRMARHSENAQKVAEFLQAHPKVRSVRYPGLKSFPEHDLSARQMSAPSGMMTFNLKAELMEHFAFIEQLKLVTHAVSLGHDQSLIFYLPTVFFFSDMVVMNDAQKEKYTRLMGDGIFRFSVGIEDADDIIEDLDQALAGV